LDKTQPKTGKNDQNQRLVPLKCRQTKPDKNCQIAKIPSLRPKGVPSLGKIVSQTKKFFVPLPILHIFTRSRANLGQILPKFLFFNFFCLVFTNLSDFVPNERINFEKWQETYPKGDFWLFSIHINAANNQGWVKITTGVTLKTMKLGSKCLTIFLPYFYV
jgi:hypothetical protein